jgi:putative endonuclease
VSQKNIGNLGENLIRELLKVQGWQILATQWRCRWGELDIVARDRYWLIFVEVKTRSLNNLDLNGALAVNKSKQKKLYLSALEFLGRNPQLASLSCRFDVALVMADSHNGNFELQTYIESAFSIPDV